MEELNLSWSKLNTFISCPLKYKLAYIDEAPAEKKEGAALSFYKAVSGAIEYFHKKGLNPIPSRDDLMALLERNWVSSGYRDNLEEKQFRATAEEVLSKFHARFLEEKPRVSYVGLRASAKIDSVSVSTVIDRIDLLPDGTYEVIKYKTGKSTMSAQELKEDLQAAVLYQAANAHKRFAGKVSQVSFYFLRADLKLSLSPSPQELQQANKRIIQVAKSILRFSHGPGLMAKLIKRSEAEPGALGEKGALCASCEYLNVCPAWPVKPISLTDDSPEEFAERVRLSYSKLNSYKRCPRAWKKVYLDGRGQKGRSFFSFGSAIHDTLENFYEPEARIKPTLKNLLGLWEEAFAENQDGYGGDKEAAASDHKKGVEMLERYFARYVEGGKYRPAYRVEEYFELPVGKNAVVTGFIDRLDSLEDGTYAVLDYKTEPSMRTQEAVDKDDQLTIYFIACEKLFGIEISRLVLLMLAHDTEISTRRSREDLPELMAAIDTSAAEIKDKVRSYQQDGPSEESPHFPPRKNRYCKSCDFIDTCSLQNEIASDGSIVAGEFDEDAFAEEYE